MARTQGQGHARREGRIMIEVDVRRRHGAFTLDAQFAANAMDTGDRGGVTVLFGRSGAGKTSLVNLLAGLDRPDSGRIVIGGAVLFDSETGVDLPPEQRRLGYVFQDGRLFPHLSVLRNLTYGMKRTAGGGPVTLETAIDLLDLGALLDRRPATLSGGEKQRVAIGRALLANPRLLLMDEPLASLDAARKNEILPFIEQLRDETGIPIVYVSHALDEVIRLADTLVLLSDGKVVAVGGVEDLMSRLDLRPLTGRYEAGAVIAATVRSHDEAGGLTLLDFAGGTMRVPYTDLPLGKEFRVRVRARDVSLALTEPTDISILNVFPGTVREIGGEPGPQVDVLIDIGCPLWARITRHALDKLAIAPGKPVHALVKAVAFDRHSLGHGAGRFRPSDETD
ncbi:MAG: molybdenum ABC transporter ATP-binding protein [Alphaproteobacteria bacterium]|nr:molybdenum ABC transporter ATP-binding protein [Alphaproteobacteria bacterium]